MYMQLSGHTQLRYPHINFSFDVIVVVEVDSLTLHRTTLYGPEDVGILVPETIEHSLLVRTSSDWKSRTSHRKRELMT